MLNSFLAACVFNSPISIIMQMFYETRVKQPNSGSTRCTKTQKQLISTRPKHTTKAGPTSRGVEEPLAVLVIKLTESSSVANRRLCYMLLARLRYSMGLGLINN